MRQVLQDVPRHSLKDPGARQESRPGAGGWQHNGRAVQVQDGLLC